SARRPRRNPLQTQRKRNLPALQRISSFRRTMDPAMEEAGLRSLTTGHGNLILASNSFAETNLRISH
ncbi:MAG: hypothetical protein ABSF23_07920, partial [Terracidiphilus sp.]